MHLELDNNDLNIVMTMLSQGPFRDVAPVIQKIQAQVMAQQAPATPEVPEPAGAV